MKQGLNAMLQKQAGSVKIEKQRIIFFA